MAEKYLETIYYDPSHPASYSGVFKLYTFVKNDGKYRLTLEDIEDWLKSQETYSVYKPVKQNYATQKIIPIRMDYLHDMDLADMQAVSKYNDNYRFLLIVIDIFSRYLWVEPSKSKYADDIIEAYDKIIQQGRIPELLRSDQGSEFINAKFQAYVKKHGIHHYTTQNIQHANYAERAIRTLKGRIYKMFYKNQNYRYIDDLQDIVSAYNNSVHSTIKMKPSSIQKSNETSLWLNHYLPLQLESEQKRLKMVPKLKPGDTVRVSYVKSRFPREYHQRFSEEYFIVKYVKPTYPVRYMLQDLNGEVIKGSFYEQELQKIVPPDAFKIDKILQTRGKGRGKQALIRWMGYPPAFDSWIPYTDVKDYK